ncbi:MAG: hypothetical protein U5J63_03280 [Fodinibius sp.]|nr:hypothetical protein [Fodinibius sp.]
MMVRIDQQVERRIGSILQPIETIFYGLRILRIDNNHGIVGGQPPDCTSALGVVSDIATKGSKTTGSTYDRLETALQLRQQGAMSGVKIDGDP